MTVTSQISSSTLPEGECINVTNCFDVPFIVRRVLQGQSRGLGFKLTHESEKPIVEFYDARYVSDQWPLGQFVSSYYEETLLEHAPGQGLLLQGSVPEWRMDGDNMLELLDWIDAQRETSILAPQRPKG